MTQSHTAKQVADYFLNYVEKDEESGEALTNLKIQKLAYYAQGFALAVLGRPLFAERIEAWPHGPVVPDLYREYKNGMGIVGNAPVPPPLDFCAADHFNEEEIDLLSEVFQVYGQFSAWKLRDMTHSEPPWIKAWGDGKNPDREITHESLKAYFSTRIKDSSVMPYDEAQEG